MKNLLLRLLSLLILQGKMSILSTCSTAPQGRPSDVTGRQVKAGTQFITVSISLFRLSDIL